MGLGSGIRDLEKTYSGSRSQKGTGYRIRIRNTATEVKSYYTTAVCRARLFKSKFGLAMEFSS